MWTCKTCTLENDDFRNKCKVCGEPKNQSLDDYDCWGTDMRCKPKDLMFQGKSCSRCTYINDRFDRRCSMCHFDLTTSPGDEVLNSPFVSDDLAESHFTKEFTASSLPEKDASFDIDRQCPQCTFVNDSFHRRCQMCYYELLSSENPMKQPSMMHAASNDDFDVANEIRIVLIGRTGSGKSATGNSILGHDQFESLVSGSSVTNKCKRGETSRGTKKVVVVDTPGLFDTGMTNEKVTKEIVKCIGMTSPGPHAMVLVVGIGRFTKEEQDTVQHFVDHFGEGMLRYMIILFTRKDDLSRKGQTLDHYIMTVPPELKSLLRQCSNRCIAFNNNAHSHEMESQVDEFFAMVDQMLDQNGRTCYTSELYREAEETLQRRMRRQKEILEMEKRQEKEKIRRQIEGQFNQTIEKEVSKRKHLEAEMASLVTIQQVTEKEKQFLNTQIHTLERKLSDENCIERRQIETEMKSLKQQLKEAENRNQERELRQLERELEATNRKHEKQIEEKNKEISRLQKKTDEEYKQKMRSDRLREQERNNVEKEEEGILNELVGGLKKVGSGLLKFGKKILSFLPF